MVSFVRSSKYRHIFGTAYKPEKCYNGIKITKSPHDGNMCSVNNKFLAVCLEAQGGGAFMVAPLSKTGRFDINYPKVAGHKGAVLDIAWNPFDDNEIASASEDCLVKLWHIPDEGLSSNMENEAEVKKLSGHLKKVQYVCWHPCAKDILASSGGDCIIFIWNTSTGEKAHKLQLHPDMIQSICWNYNGSVLATTCKDKKLRIIDPRKEEVIFTTPGHEGNKPSKVVFCGGEKNERLFTTGFSRMSDRQYALWDPVGSDKPEKAVTLTNIDTGSGVLFPFYDRGTSVVYLSGKGDTQIKYFEINDNSPYVHFLTMHTSTTGGRRSVAAMPKRNLDFMKCETMRFYSLTNKGNVEPITMTVPRKSDMFQDDIFPPCEAGEPSLEAAEWLGGANRDPKLVKFTEDGVEAVPGVVESKPFTLKPRSEKKDPSVMKRFNSPQPDDARPTPVTLDEYRKAWPELVKENEELRRQIRELKK